MANELVIPPDIMPESPVKITLVDDQTFPFRPQFARGYGQRNTYGDPRWRFVHRYKGLRQKDSARMHAVVSETQGAYRTVLVSPGQVNAGTWNIVVGGEALAADLSSISGWTAGADAALSVSNQILRVKRAANTTSGAAYLQYNATGLTANMPYVWRFLCQKVAGSANVVASLGGAFIDVMADAAVNAGYHSRAIYSTATTGTVYADNTGASVSVAGEFYDLSFASLSACPLVDGGGNLLLQSSVFGTTWTTTGASISSNTAISPDGTASADDLVENSSTSAHFVEQAVTGLASAAADYSFSIAVKAFNRSWVLIQLIENTGSTAAQAYFNASTGVAGSTPSAGANWSSLRVAITSYGSSWYVLTITARKTNAATSLTARVLSVTADNGSTSFLGNGLAAHRLWCGTLTQSSVPTRLTQSTTVAVAASSQSGPTFYLKGLPASQNGLAVSGDWVEIDGQLKRLTASLDSDAAGKGILHFRPKIYRAVASNTPVVMTKPLGRFVIGNDVDLDAMYGLNSDYELTLEEVYE